MVTQLIRSHIAQVLSVPNSDAVMRERIAQLSTGNGQALPAQAQAQIVAVVHGYVMGTVDLLDACADAAARAGVAQFVMPLLDLSGRYFLTPQDYVPDGLGLLGLLDDAYLARHLLAQISALYQQNTGIALIPVPLAADNTIVRALIGEPLASRLDQEVASTIQSAIVQANMSQMYGTPQGLGVSSPTGGPGAWGGCVEDELARIGAECGISINYE
jgi:hypothetical protein